MHIIYNYAFTTILIFMNNVSIVFVNLVYANIFAPIYRPPSPSLPGIPSLLMRAEMGNNTFLYYYNNGIKRYAYNG